MSYNKKKVVRFMTNRLDGAGQYDLQIDNAFKNQSHDFLYFVQDIKNYKKLPRVIALIFFWIRAQYILFFGNINIAIVSPWMMLIYPKKVSIISISHHFDPTVFKGIRLIYVKLSHWLFMIQSSRVDVVVSCSKYWSNYYKQKGFKKALTILNGFDIKAMDNSLNVLDNTAVLKKFNLKSKNYIHLGSYGLAKGQNMVIECLKGLELQKVATCSSKVLLTEGLKDVHIINASFEEYNVLLKNAYAVICMSEFKEGWCRVLHEAAIHGTPILGSGLGGMSELLNIGGYIPSNKDNLRDHLSTRIKKGSLSKDKIYLYRSFTLEKFYQAWRSCIGELLDPQEKNYKN